jgi:hypothetical protein
MPEIAGVHVPDSKIAKEVEQLILDTETPLLFHHSNRVYLWGALRGRAKGLSFDEELLYLGAMFHDLGLMDAYSSASERFEVDGANAARDFMRQHNFSDRDIELVWDGIALHTTPGIPKHKHPVVALVTAGVEMDVLGLGFDEVDEEARRHVCEAHPRPAFKEGIIQAFADGTKKKPDTTFGNVKADVLAEKLPGFQRTNFCDLIRGSAWPE